MTVALVLGAALALACVLFVARPFLLDPEARDDELDALTAQERRRLEQLERRDRALAALKELEFDHRSGKISDEDYRSLVGGLRRQAAEALQALEPNERSLMRNLEPPTQPDIPEPYPPPGELDPPQQPDIPEPYPPPGEPQPPAPPQIPEPYPPTDPQL